MQTRYLCVDASVAITVGRTGESKALSYLTKTQAVDAWWLKDNLQKIGVLLRKVSTKVNTSDLFTKAVAKQVLNDLSKLIGRGRKVQGRE